MVRKILKRLLGTGAAPRRPTDMLQMGINLISQGKTADAVITLERAAQSSPQDSSILANLGAAYAMNGDFTTALERFDHALDIDPTCWPALINAAEIRLSGECASESIKAFETAEAIVRLPGDVLIVYAKVLVATRRFSDAFSRLRQPNMVLRQKYEYWLTLGVASQFLGLNSHSEAALRQALRVISKERPTPLLTRIGRMNSEQGNHGNARAILARLMRKDTKGTDTDIAFARALETQGFRGRAADLYGDVLSRHPNQEEATTNLANLQKQNYQFTDAEARYRQILERNPTNAIADKNLGDLLVRSLRVDAGIAHLRRCVSAAPRNPYFHSDLIFAEHYSSVMTQKDLRQTIEEWRQKYGRASRSSCASSPRDKETINIGLISSSFRQHPVAYLGLAGLEALDPNRFSIRCYANQIGGDCYTERFSSLAEIWRPVAHLSDDRLAEVIMRDGVDILLEMSGHDAGHRLPVVARRLAPVQIKWVGGQYDTMGIDAIDYFLSDPIETPQTHFLVNAYSTCRRYTPVTSRLHMHQR